MYSISRYNYAKTNYSEGAAGPNPDPILDTYSTNVVSALSESILLRSAYTGALVRLRRSSDSAEKDFYPDSDNVLSMSSEDGAGTSLSTWISTNTAYMVTRYDQSGNGFDETQASTALQPIIVNAGSLVTYGTNNRAASLHSGYQTGIDLTYLATANDAWGSPDKTGNFLALDVGAETVSATAYVNTVFSNLDYASGWAVAFQDASTSTQLIHSTWITPTLRKNGSAWSPADRNAVHDAIQSGHYIINVYSASLSATGTWDDSGTAYQGGNIDNIKYRQCTIYWNNDYTANISDIEDNLNNVFAVY